MILRQPNKPICTLADVLAALKASELPPTRQRDLTSAVMRVSAIIGAIPGQIPADPASLRKKLVAIRPARHNLSGKTWSNLRTGFAAALELAGVVDRPRRSTALRDPVWGILLRRVARDTRRASGIAAFANWCVLTGLAPDQVDDDAVQRFATWLDARTLHLKPRNLVRAVPLVWEALRQSVPGWPQHTLARLSFRPPPHRVAWADMPESFVQDAETYLALRKDPDLFDERSWMPQKPLAPNTVRLHRELIQSAFSALNKSGIAIAKICSLADLVAVENFKHILRHFHEEAGRSPSSFLESLARGLVQIAKYHVELGGDDLQRLRNLVSKLPKVPADLTEKNKALIRQFESQDVRAKLLFLPEQLFKLVAANLDAPRLPFVMAQVALAVDVLLVAPIRPENLCNLVWRQHLSEPNGPNGPLLLHLTAEETKNKRAYTTELDPDVARRLRWYRKEMLPRLDADPNGPLFASRGGRMKTQETISQQITEALAEHVGIHMTPHQFRHVAATFYLEENAEGFETVRNLLNHASSRSTLIYAGSSSRRAGRAYNDFIAEQRDALRLKRLRKGR
jgi:integrase